MSEPVQILAVFDPLPARETIFKVNDFLVALGAEYDHECGLLLHDTADKEFDEPSYGVELKRALERIAGWENLGGLEYWFYGGIVDIDFNTTIKNYVEAVTISILRCVYYEHGYRQRYLKLCVDLHYLLHAQRTILGYALDDVNYFKWLDELNRVKRHEFKESRDLELDIKLFWTKEKPPWL